MTAQLLWDAFKGLIISLRPPTIFPAAIFVLAQVYVVPRLLPDFEYDATESIVLWIGLSVMCSYMLHGMGFWLMNLFRGVGWSQTFLGGILQKEKKLGLSGKEKVFTEFGHILQEAFAYPYERYGMEWEALRRCFEPILVEQKYQPFIDREKDILSLFINMTAISIVLGIEFFYVFLFLGNFIIAVAVPIISLGLVAIFYSCMLNAAERWGETIKTACDLYRHKLAQSLFLRPATTLMEEKYRWQKTTQFILFNKPGSGEFIPQSQIIPLKETVEHLEKYRGIKT